MQNIHASVQGETVRPQVTGLADGAASPAVGSRIGHDRRVGDDPVRVQRLPMVTAGLGIMHHGAPLALSTENPTPSGWTYGLCPLETPAERFGPFAGLVRIWQERRPDGGGLPARTAFKVEDFAAWMGRIFIAKLEADPFDLRFTLWGTTLTQWWGVDYTGKTLGEQSLNPESWATERRYFQTMSRTPSIGLAGGYLTQHGRDHVKVVGLDLPLSAGTHPGLSQVLSAHLRIELTEDFGDILPDCPRAVFGDDG